MVAHRGIAQGHLVADVLTGITRHWDHRSMPAVCFTDQEVFAVGMPPTHGLRCGQRLRSDSDRHRAVQVQWEGPDLGRRRWLRPRRGRPGERRGGRIHGVGSGVAELASAASYAIELGITLQDLESSVIAHPTLSKALTDAVLDAIRPASRLSTPGRISSKPRPPDSCDHGCDRPVRVDERDTVFAFRVATGDETWFGGRLYHRPK
jgi:dihydrolipoamide dehydrogenase